MELTLERSDLCQVGTISHLNTLALTEDKKSGRLRIVVGDDNGDVQAFEIKRGDAKSIFKTSAGKGGVQAICTGGGKVKDRVFVAVGQVKTISMRVNCFEAVSKQFQNHCETILNCFGKNMISTKKHRKTYFGTEDAFLEG